MTRNLPERCICVLILLLSAVTLTFAQSGTSSLRGTVTDPAGAIVPDATIILSSAEIAVNLTTQTDKNGFYQFQAVRPATYALTVTATGFAIFKQSGLELLVSTPATSDVKLQLASGTTTVEVQAASQTVNTQDATIGNTFDSRQILALPFEGRDAAGVLSLQPGVTFVGTNVDDNIDTRNGALNGGRSDQANITLDGVDNNQQARGTAFQGAVRSTLDSIEEFRVTTAGDNADQGRSSGGQVTLVTKSGTNTFHGALYEQNRPTVTAANGWFNKHTELLNGQPNIPQKIIRNTFGGSLGGPILKDRLFFFGTYEGQRQAEDVEVSRNVPGLPLRNDSIAYPTATGGVQTLTAAQIKQMDPNCTGLGTCPLGNGPDPAAVAAFNQYPLPNSTACGNNDGFNIACFSFSAANPTHLNTTIAKIDYNITRSGSHRLFVRGNYQTDRIAQPPQFPGQPPANVIRDTSRAIAVGYTAVLSNINNGLINPFFLNNAPAGHPGSLDPSCVADAAAQGNTPPAFCTWNFPAVDPNNLAVYDSAIIDLVGIVDQVTGNFNRDKNNNQIPQGTLVPRHFRSWEYEWYAQDSWHIKPNLTITAGLRYTILEPPYETNGNQVAPTLSLNQFVNQRAALAEQGQVSSPVFGLNLSGQANGKQPYWPYDYKNLGPRIAVAYSPNPSGGLMKALFGGAGKSSFRAGFGIVYDHFGEGLVDTFDSVGSFGLTTVITNPASVQTVDGGARFTGLHDVPVSSHDGQLLANPPSGPFPFTPPVSTLSNNTQQIAYGLDDKLKTPYSELVDISFTRELPGGFVLEAAYVGRFAHRLLQQRDLAMPLNFKDPKSGVDYFTAATTFSKDFYAGVTPAQIQPIPYWENLFPAAAGTCGANTTATQCMYTIYSSNIGPGTFGETNGIFNFDAFCFPACLNQQPGQDPTTIPAGQPGGPFQFYNPQFTALYAWSSIGKSAYNAGQLIIRSRPKHGLQMDFNYTFSQSLDVCSDAERVPQFGGLCAVVNTWSPNQLRGPSDFDARHQINTNWVYELPFGRGQRFGHDWNRAIDTLLGGWEVVGLARWTSGFPFSVGPGGTFPTNFQIGGQVFNLQHVATGTTFLGPNGDPFAFKLGPAADTFLGQPGVTNPNFRFAFPGESGQRNNFRGDGFFGVDLGVNKTFKITERQNLRFSASAFNLTNSVRFDPATLTVNTNLQNAQAFGQYTQTLTNPRVMEFALRYQF